jgi:1,4-alpha-glucan branching enzyme
LRKGDPCGLPSRISVSGKGTIVRKKMKEILKKNIKKTSQVLRRQTSKQETNNRIKKHYLKSRPACKVTFKLPKVAVENAARVMIVGEFNNWDAELTQLKKIQSGDFSITLELEKDREYRFRYLIDNTRWENDWHADKYIPNPYGCDDSVVIV